MDAASGDLRQDGSPRAAQRPQGQRQLAGSVHDSRARRVTPSVRIYCRMNSR